MILYVCVCVCVCEVIITVSSVNIHRLTQLQIFFFMMKTFKMYFL